MKYKIHTGSGNTALTAVKNWPSGTTAGILLSSFGTELHKNTVAPEAAEKTLQLTGTAIQAQLEYIANAKQSHDVRFAATMLLDAMQQCNQRIRQINQFLGTGIYIGGCIVYCIDDTCLTLPFGGGCWITGDGKKCIPETAPDHPLIRDALGCTSDWSAEFQKGKIKENERVILLTAYPDNIEQFQKELENDPKNVLTMYAYRQFSSKDVPVAALEFWY